MLKMNELMKQTGESKSTLLYYVKEGLLPEPHKPKPNVHLYEKRCVEIVKFIKYFQHTLFYSLSQIKQILKDNTINFEDDIEMLINSLDVISVGERVFSHAEVLEITQIDAKTLLGFQTRGLIRQDTQYSSKDIEAISILKESSALNSLLDAYVQTAKELAKLEHESGAKLIKTQQGNNDTHTLIFDTILKLKPYIFNTHTLEENKQRMQK